MGVSNRLLEYSGVERMYTEKREKLKASLKLNNSYSDNCLF